MDRAARHLASYGRHGDDTLLHVSRAELAGIRQLTGKGFTTNPDTGLPEAFNWAKAILPAIAGIGITALTGGLGAPAALAGLAGAAGSGATSFGIGKAQGESTNQALMGGLISGATSFAGGQLLSGVGDAATNIAAATPAELASGAASNAASTASSFGAEAAFNPATDAALQATSGGYSQVAGQAAGQDAGQTAGQAAGASSAMSGIGDSFSALGDRAQNVVSNPGAAAARIAANVQDRPMSALTAGAGLYSSMSSPTGQPRMPGQTPYDPNKYPERFPAQQPRYTPDPAGYVPGISPERNYNFAKGGLASLRGEEGMTANIVNEAKAALLNEHPRPKEALARFEGMFGADALGMLRDRIAGGQVRGAGSGMDDLVPGSIEGRQKVRLADGEFVLPAHIVSAIGDGSTDHGVRRLHEMMDSIYKQKYKSEGLPKRLKKGTLVDGS
jgi:hypothetical protein